MGEDFTVEISEEQCVFIFFMGRYLIYEYNKPIKTDPYIFERIEIQKLLTDGEINTKRIL